MRYVIYIAGKNISTALERILEYKAMVLRKQFRDVESNVEKYVGKER